MGSDGIIDGEIVDGEIVDGEIALGGIEGTEVVAGEIVEGEIVEGELVDGEIVAPTDWTGREVEHAADSPEQPAVNEAPPAPEVAPTQGALPADIHIDTSLPDDDALTGAPGLDEEEEEGGIDFGGALGDEEGVNLDDVDLDYDQPFGGEDDLGDLDAQIGEALPDADLEDLPAIGEAGKDDGALPIDIDLGETSSDIEGVIQESTGGDSLPGDGFDLWDASLAGEWRAEPRQTEERVQSVRSLLAEGGIEPPTADVELGALYRDTSTDSLLDESIDGVPSAIPGEHVDSDPLPDIPVQKGTALLAPDQPVNIPAARPDYGSSSNHELDASISLLRQLTAARREHIELLDGSGPAISVEETLLDDGDRKIQRFGWLLDDEVDVIEEMTGPESLVGAPDIEIALDLDDEDVTYVFDEGDLSQSGVFDLGSQAYLGDSVMERPQPIITDPLTGPYARSSDSHDELMGTPLLGVIPSMPSLDGSEFPAGSLALAVEQIAPTTPILPDRPLEGESIELEGWLNDFLNFLKEEAYVGAEPARVARALHGLGHVVGEYTDHTEAALRLLEAGYVSDPTLLLNDWHLASQLEAAGESGRLLEHLLSDRSTTSEQQHFAGHVARQADADSQSLWAYCSDRNMAAALARFISALGDYSWETAFEAIESLRDHPRADSMRSVFALERARLAEETRDQFPTSPDYLLALEKSEAIIGSSVRAELRGIESGDSALLARALQRLIAAPKADDVRRVTLAKLALAHNRAGHFSEALATYEALLKMVPDDRDALRQAALLARRMGKIKAHRAYMARLADTATDPREAALRHYENGVFLQRYSEDEAAAEAAFRSALSALPTFTPALARLSRISRIQGRHDEINRRYIAEIQQLEKVLERDLGSEDRGRTVSGLVQRYFRLAVALNREEQGSRAAELHKRALALQPDATPSLVALESLFRESGDWTQLVALLLGWSLRTRAGSLATVESLLQAADVSRTFLNDTEAGGQLLARVLNIAPNHPYALQRAQDHFARDGQLIALIEVLERLAERTGALHHQLRIAGLQSSDLMHPTRSRSALSVYARLLEKDAAHSSAVEGAVRSLWAQEQRLNEVPEADLQALVSAGDPQAVLCVIDALMAEQSDEEAAQLLAMWRARRLSAGNLGAEGAQSTLAVLVVLLERLADWPALVDALEELAISLPAEDQAAVLARLGEIWEIRIGDLSMAEDAYRRSLELVPTTAAATEGLARITPTTTPTLQPDFVFGADLDEVRGAALRRERRTVSELLDRKAEESATDEQRSATRTVQAYLAGDKATLSDEFTLDPSRIDVFEALRRNLESSGNVSELAGVIESHLESTTGERRSDLLGSLLGLRMRDGDTVGARDAAERLLDVDPDSMVGRLALRRLASADGSHDYAQTQTAALLDSFRSPEATAQLHHAQALGQNDPDGDQLLAKGVRLDPQNHELARTYEARLEARGLFAELDALYEHRLKVVESPQERSRLARQRAMLLADQFSETGLALQVLEAEFERSSPEPDDLLMAARFCQALGYPERADDYFAQADAQTEDLSGSAQKEISVAHATALLERGELKEASTRLHGVLDGTVADQEALLLLGEIAAKSRDWREVIKIKRRLIAYEDDARVRAEHAVGIGEIFSRVYQDNDRALGWFCRAVEFAPLEQPAIRRALAELAAIGSSEERTRQVQAVLAEASSAREGALREEGAVVDHLAALFELRSFQGDVLGQFRVASVLDWLGRATPEMRVAIEEFRGEFKLRRPLDNDLRSRYMESPTAHDRPAALYDAASMVLVEDIAPIVPAGIPRLSRRSFKEWQTQFQQLAFQLGIPAAELWNGGRALDGPWATYLPHPAIAIPINMFEAGFHGEQRFQIAQTIEGLRRGRHLLRQPGVKAAAKALHQLCTLLRASAIEPERGSKQYKALERAKRLSRPKRLRLEGAEESLEDLEIGLLALAAETQRAMDQVGLLAVGNIQSALDLVVFGQTDRSREAKMVGGRYPAYATSGRAQALVSFFVSEAFSELCRFDRREQRGGDQ